MPGEKHAFQRSAQTSLALVGGDSASEKRCRSPDRFSTGELSSKRRRKKVERRITSEDQQATVITKSAMKNVTALLENQQLLLESKFRDKIHANTLELVTQLRAETRLWRQKTSILLEKEINDCRSKLDRRVGLKKGETSKTLQKFPWLRKTITQLMTIKKFEWEDLPTDVSFKILRFLQDEDLFVLRGVSTQFYEAFYNQEGQVDCRRCLRLAKRGRRFANLKFITYEKYFYTKEEMSRVLPSNFPKLEVLWLYYESPAAINSLPNLRELRFTAYTNDDLKWVTDKKFPALKTLIVRISFRPFGENRLVHLPGHKSLTHFGFADWLPAVKEIKVVTKEKFPQLEVVAITEGKKCPQILDYLAQQNFKFIDNTEELTPDTEQLYMSKWAL